MMETKHETMTLLKFSLQGKDTNEEEIVWRELFTQESIEKAIKKEIESGNNHQPKARLRVLREIPKG